MDTKLISFLWVLWDVGRVNARCVIRCSIRSGELNNKKNKKNKKNRSGIYLQKNDKGVMRKRLRQIELYAMINSFAVFARLEMCRQKSTVERCNWTWHPFRYHWPIGNNRLGFMTDLYDRFRICLLLCLILLQVHSSKHWHGTNPSL